MIPKGKRYSLHYDNVRWDFYGRHMAQYQLQDTQYIWTEKIGK